MTSQLKKRKYTLRINLVLRIEFEHFFCLLFDDISVFHMFEVFRMRDSSEFVEIEN